MIDLPPPSYVQTAQAIESCGVARSKIRIKYEGHLQSDEVRIGDLGGVSDERLRCVRKAVHPFYILTLDKSDQQAAFNDLASKDDRPVQLQRAKEWAQSRGKSALIPVFEEAKGVVLFASELEHACGLKKGSILVSGESRFLSLQHETTTFLSFRRSAKALECVMQMFAASNANDYDLEFVFYGNAAIGEEKK